MRTSPSFGHRKQRLCAIAAGAVLAVALATDAFASAAGDALRERHATLAPALEHSPFQRPIHIESTETPARLTGEVHAVVDHSFRRVEGALKGAQQWCDILILPFNVKQCHAIGQPTPKTLALHVGRKHDQPVGDAYRVDFAYRVVANHADYLQVHLNADTGPLGTKDYRIVVEATPLDANRSFLRMSYAYGYGFMARVAMLGYLSTAGRDKIGFSVVGRRPDGTPVHVDHMRGVVERNAMRYYLAIDAYLDSLSAAPHQRTEHRLRGWFAATERYPRQLHEIEQDEYLTMKRREIRRQRSDTQTAKVG
ncbi:hypothetical protein [Piscinibacter sp.]|uniref:hypothetical protein n=1 Tax=Piscinibacter sp. TaxID=1903157 RepID=UPI002C810344|nr:hypothetical protein [Albitalea sp.]HUG23345.1 hypothetical protein [Albitalea sp.]